MLRIVQVKFRKKKSEKAYSEYEKYKVIQDRSYISDFDRFNSGNDDDTPLLPFNIDPKELGLSRCLNYVMVVPSYLI